ncbi:MAG: NAD-dependent epimerase/dehydratase family protein, partial [Thermoanaerobaculia bacterium]
MKLLVTGACGFVGATLIKAWKDEGSTNTFVGIDSLVRPGSDTNRLQLQRLGVDVIHADIRMPSDFESLPDVDAVIDCAAQPSVLAGVDGKLSSRQVVEHNLLGTINILEYCRRKSAALVLLSTSRVYSIPPLAALRVHVVGDAFEPDPSAVPAGLTQEGIDETFSTAAPVSLYGSTKLASEALALEYGETYRFPVWVNRCGVLAGAGQFGRPDQGIFSFWLNSWLRERALRYTGFGGHGHQVRDCLHPADLVPLIDAQLASSEPGKTRILNVSGGRASAMSLRQLSGWCEERLGARTVGEDATERAFDLPWIVLDASKATEAWRWRPRRTTE